MVRLVVFVTGRAVDGLNRGRRKWPPTLETGSGMIRNVGPVQAVTDGLPDKEC